MTHPHVACSPLEPTCRWVRQGSQLKFIVDSVGIPEGSEKVQCEEAAGGVENKRLVFACEQNEAFGSPLHCTEYGVLSNFQR